MRVRRLVPMLLVLALSGCGQAASSSAEFEGEEARVAEVVDELSAASERRDGTKICADLITEDLVSDFEAGDVSCSEELDDALREADDSTLEVTSVEVSGDSATAEVTGQAGDEDREATFEFEKVEGSWRISSFGG